jgi:REP-associated tyrosine transposase
VPRKPRVHGAETLYHVTVLATGFEALFLGDDDRLLLYRILEYAVEKHGWEIRAFVVMTTHLHLLVFTPEDDISRGMQLICGIYMQVFNKEHGRRGHLVRGRFGSVVVERPGHALEVSRYIALNPVRGGICERPEQWRWSSYPATIGLALPPPFLEPGWVLGLFAEDERVAARRFREFVEAALPEGVGVRPLSLGT